MRTGLRSFLKLLAAATMGSAIGAPQLIAAYGDTRELSFHSIHTKETVRVLFKKDGKYVASGLKKANWIFRDWRRNEATKMDPKLLDLLWEVHQELGSKKPIHIISGYRSLKTNNMLRRTVGGQAKKSRHILGKAVDVYFPDVPLKRLRYSALVREIGGVGYYPTSAIPFIHVDTGRVRHWPRLPRYELALLFPDGTSRHRPARGGPITAKDVSIARGRHKKLAVRIAKFHDFRKTSKRSVLVAAKSSPGAPVRVARKPSRKRIAAITPPPKLVAAPKIAARPAANWPAAVVTKPGTRPSKKERNALAQLALAAVAPPPPKLLRRPRAATRRENTNRAPAEHKRAARRQLASLQGGIPAFAPTAPHSSALKVDSPRQEAGWSNGWVTAPAFDEEHPEEMSYRPFPIAPLLTSTASSDDPALTGLTHPDAARTLELLDGIDSVPAMKFRPGRQIVRLLWSRHFTGAAVDLGALYAGGSNRAAEAGLNRRQVTTTSGG